MSAPGSTARCRSVADERRSETSAPSDAGFPTSGNAGSENGTQRSSIRPPAANSAARSLTAATAAAPLSAASFHQKAAVYCARLATYHPLPDGNKRTAYDVMREFIDRNEHNLHPPRRRPRRDRPNNRRPGRHGSFRGRLHRLGRRATQRNRARTNPSSRPAARRHARLSAAVGPPCALHSCRVSRSWRPRRSPMIQPVC
ncbi:MAG: hypothetical protein DLM58_20640 [Pseudonocardiales bacterium]|nr:MAG: hypothetical protein DLM58_20640 [Pseudonocardiales bacterium]